MIRFERKTIPFETQYIILIYTNKQKQYKQKSHYVKSGDCLLYTRSESTQPRYNICNWLIYIADDIFKGILHNFLNNHSSFYICACIHLFLFFLINWFHLNLFFVHMISMFLSCLFMRAESSLIDWVISESKI